MIQFATGLSLHKGKVYVTYGVNDHTNRISVYELEKILQKCIPFTK